MDLDVILADDFDASVCGLNGLMSAMPNHLSDRIWQLQNELVGRTPSSGDIRQDVKEILNTQRARVAELTKIVQDYVRENPEKADLVIKNSN